MDNETKQMFELIINKLSNMESRQSRMETRLDNMDARFDNMDARLEKMNARFDNMDARLDNMNARLDGMEIGFEVMGSRQDEIYQIVKAIEHSNQVHKAEIDNINFRLAHTEGTIQGVGEYIIQRRAAK